MPAIAPVIFYYLFTAVLLTNGHAAGTDSVPFATTEKCMAALHDFADQVNSDDKVVSAWAECRPVVLTPPHGEVVPDAPPAPTLHVPGKGET